MKGTVIISETLLEAVGVIISFIMIVLVVQLVFQTQTQATYQSAFEAVARDISTAIDRAAASSGSLSIQQDLPKGLNVNVSIDYKTVIISSNGNAVRKSFSSLTKMPPVNFYNPTTLCIIKTQNDNRVSIVSGSCQCNTKDSKCDPACNGQGVCDPACINSTVGVCNPYCSANNPSSCDANCYQNFTTGVCEKGCISNSTITGICSPDCNNVKKGVCSLDCYNQYSNGNTGICDPDCPTTFSNLIHIGNLTVKPSDGHCYTGCINTTASVSHVNPSPLKGPCTSDVSNYQCLGNDVWQCGSDILGCAFGNNCGMPCQYPTNPHMLCCAHSNPVSPYNSTDSVCCCEYNGGTCGISSRGECLISGSFAYPSDSQYCKQSSSNQQTFSKINESCNHVDTKNYHCLVVSKTGDYTSRNYTDYTNQIWSCGSAYANCAGQLCDENASIEDYGHVLCHVSYVDPNMFPQTPVCCCVGSTCQPSTRQDCLTASGNISDSNDPKCIASPTQNPVNNNKITLLSDGICDQDCNATANICDPDCPNSPACQNICSIENEKSTDSSPCCAGLVACPGDNVCKKVSDPLACCANGICEGRPGTSNGWGPGNKTRWETFYTCPQDCPTDPQTKSTNCQSGSFTESVCYQDVYDSSGNFVGFTPVWNNNVIGVCQSAVQQFLDRRNWDINEVIQTWTSSAPEGWAWDISRYTDACNRMQSASITVATNENYTSNANTCCGLSSAACDSNAQYSPQCLGVGFCIDHSTGVLSILRTLGVPANDVYSVFELAQSTAHAWVLLKCDSNEPANRQPTQCQGNWGKWLSIDATNHYVALLDPSQYSTLCLMWNDQGLYAQNAGKIDATSGYAYDPSIPKSNTADSSLCIYDKLCKQPFGIDCVVPG